MGTLLQSLTVSAAGMSVQTQRLGVVAQNIANADTPGYRGKQVVFAQEYARGAAPGLPVLEQITLDRSAGKQVYAPRHPLAGADGYYTGSNVNLMTEIADSKQAQRSFEANLRSFDNARQMSRALLDLLKR